jgi:hypothetical protein
VDINWPGTLLLWGFLALGVGGAVWLLQRLRRR